MPEPEGSPPPLVECLLQAAIRKEDLLRCPQWFEQLQVDLLDYCDEVEKEKRPRAEHLALFLNSMKSILARFRDATQDAIQAGNEEFQQLVREINTHLYTLTARAQACLDPGRAASPGKAAAAPANGTAAAKAVGAALQTVRQAVREVLPELAVYSSELLRLAGKAAREEGELVRRVADIMIKDDNL